MIKLDKSFLKLAAVCAVGIILNVIGVWVVKILNLNVYLDTLGTIFIAALGGYLPGIAVGFFTNLIGSIFSPSEMYFSLVSVLLAVLTAFLASKGYYQKFPKILMTIPATILVTGFFGALIEELLSFSNSFDSWSSVEKIFLHFMQNLSNELPDKGLAILLSFFALKFTPTVIKESFHTMGKMQAPVSKEMRRAISSKNKFVLSLRTKMIFNLISVTLLVAIFITVISYTTYRDSAIEERIRIANGIVSMIINEIDPKRVDEFIELGHHAKGYNDVERELYSIRASNSDIKYLYVYKIKEDGCHVVFDLETAAVPASSPGEVEEFDETFEPYLPDLLAGRPIPPIISNEKYGYLLTIYKPVYNSVGTCTCYAAIDFSMDLVRDQGRMFIAKVVALFAGAVIFIFALGLWFIENNIILPVNTMAYCARNFAYDSETARAGNVESIKNLEIKTNDEIENLYAAFLKTTADSMNNFKNLKRAEIQVAVMDELAHTDALTGLKNKTAYVERVAKFDNDIAEGRGEFCIIMIDVNFLKRVNDTYGHEYGNIYLINAGKLVCSIFGEENVYRIGGDEFVVVLDGEALARCEEDIAALRSMIDKLRIDSTLKAWEKVSAAVGVAYYESGVDTCADEVFKRADADMYQNKLAMKAVRKD